MFRKDLIVHLRDQPRSVNELARVLQMKSGDLEEDLWHLERSLRNTDQRLVVSPARCRQCGFTFREDKLTKPGKCPNCRSTRIEPPLVQVVGSS